MKIRTLTAEYRPEGCWLTMDENGRTAEYESAEVLVAAIRKRDARSAKRTGEDVATMIDYRNAPAGFTVPT